jgi:hypothetical protein
MIAKAVADSAKIGGQADASVELRCNPERFHASAVDLKFLSL